MNIADMPPTHRITLMMELRNCLMQLMEQKELTESLGQKGYEKTMSQYTNKALARELLNFYQELVCKE